jgi:hypothetical protein
VSKSKALDAHPTQIAERRLGSQVTKTSTILCPVPGRSPRDLAQDAHQIVMAPVGGHNANAKPGEVRRRIERLFAGPYLEHCTFRPARGRTVWGNEVPRDSFFQDAIEQAATGAA